jgi:hypothetical protein
MDKKIKSNIIMIKLNKYYKEVKKKNFFSFML